MSELSRRRQDRPVSAEPLLALGNAWRSLGSGAALIVLLTVVAYIPTFRCGFIWDDGLLITDNRLIRASDGLYRFWCTTEAPDYYPLTWSLWWLEWRLWGNNAAGYHGVNVLLHAVNAVLVWVILRRLNPAPKAFGAGPGAWLAAVVFAVHPVNVATVAWISEQKNTLSMLFSALSILLYLRFDEEGSVQLREATISARPAVAPYQRTPKKRSEVGLDSVHDTRAGRRATRAPSGWMWYALSLVAFLLALLTKTAVVMLPVVLLGCLWWRHGRVRWKDWLYCMPFFVFSFLLSLVTIWFQHHRAMAGDAFRAGGFAPRLAAAGWVPWFYLYKALLPVDLTVVYPNWKIDVSRWISWLPGLALVSCFALFWWKRRTWGKPLFFGLGYFVVTLFPVLGFFDQGFYQFSLVADHWQYHSIIGVIAPVVAGGQWICGQMDRKGWHVGVVMGAAVVTVLAIGTWRRCGVYTDSETLWRDNVARDPNVWPAHNSLGAALMQAGKSEDAIKEFERALQIKPDLAVAEYNLAGAYKRLGRMREAIEHYQRALQIKPNYAEAHNNLGVVLGQAGDLKNAIEHLEQAVRLKPDMAEAHNNLAVALDLAGRVPEAIRQLEQAVRLKPDFVEAQDRLARLRAAQ